MEVITSEKDRWVDVKMKEGLKMSRQQKSPLLIGGITYTSFILVGLIPLLIFVIDYMQPIQSNLFLISSLLTAGGFLFIGWLKAYVNQTRILKGVFETVGLGAIAALVAYYVGAFLEHLLS